MADILCKCHSARGRLIPFYKISLTSLDLINAVDNISDTNGGRCPAGEDPERRLDLKGLE
jgi:hypothetical protein